MDIEFWVIAFTFWETAYNNVWFVKSKENKSKEQGWPLNDIS